MPDAPKTGRTLEDLQALVRAFRDERDWAQFHTLKDLAAAIAIEAGELQEHFLWKTEAQQDEALAIRPEPVREEIADIVILALAFAERAGIDLTPAVTQKLKFNAAKYPVERARGSARKYTDL